MWRSWRCATRSRCSNGSWARPGRGSLPRSGVPGRPAAPASEGRARPVPAAGPTRDSAALAPGPAGALPRGQVPPQAPRAAAHRTLHPPAGGAPGSREPVLGLPAHPRRAARPRDQGRCLHRVGDPAAGRDRPGTRADHGHVGQFPLSSALRPGPCLPAASSRPSP
jgi:hypothetical protein